jgi:YebC/PmpR family DNA-binding regulatory protein
MSGHNKWSKIKHKKAATDSAKSKVFSKFSKLIQVAVKAANGDSNSASVVSVVESAKKENVPKDVIDRAVKKASSSDSADLHEVMYEGFGPGGVGMLIKAVTDNTNRTVTEVKTIYTKNGGSFAASGAVSWGFSMDENRDWVANEGTELTLSEDDEEKLEKIIDLLEESDDITDIYHNAA